MQMSLGLGMVALRLLLVLRVLHHRDYGVCITAFATASLGCLTAEIARRIRRVEERVCCSSMELSGR